MKWWDVANEENNSKRAESSKWGSYQINIRLIFSFIFFIFLSCDIISCNNCHTHEFFLNNDKNTIDPNRSIDQLSIKYMDRFTFIKHLIYQHQRYNRKLALLLLQLYNSISTRVCLWDPKIGKFLGNGQKIGVGPLKWRALGHCPNARRLSPPLRVG